MNTIKKILVPVDFSAASRQGLHYAMQFASMIGASIVLYHSFVPFESGFYPLQKQIDENDALLKALRNRLDKLKDNELTMAGR